MMQWLIGVWDGRRNGGGQDPSYVIYMPVWRGYNQASTCVWMVPGTEVYD